MRAGAFAVSADNPVESGRLRGGDGSRCCQSDGPDSNHKPRWGYLNQYSIYACVRSSRFAVGYAVDAQTLIAANFPVRTGFSDATVYVFPRMVTIGRKCRNVELRAKML